MTLGVLGALLGVALVFLIAMVVTTVLLWKCGKHRRIKDVSEVEEKVLCYLRAPIVALCLCL